MISWFCILWTYTRWYKGLKLQGIDRKTLAYKAPFQPYLSYYGMTVAMIVLIFGGFTAFSKSYWHPKRWTRVMSQKPTLADDTAVPSFDVSSFITTYFPIPFFLVLFIGYKIIMKSKMIAYRDMDFTTGSSLDMPTEVSRVLG